jgi:hypothetical protein
VTEHTTTEPAWVTTEATVITCSYQSPGLSILAFGFQTGEKFRIAFDYYAYGRLYSDEFQSPIAIPQNKHFPVTYNPLNPEQNSRGHGSRTKTETTRPPILIIGIIGSVLISLLWLAALRSCQ